MRTGPDALGRLAVLALKVFRRLPRPVRMGVVRAVAPSYTAGALCVVEHDGTVLMLRQHHRHGWTLPGGLLDRGEDAREAVTREVAEETGLRIDAGDPVGTVVEPRSRRVDLLFHVPVAHRPAVTPRSEVQRAAWLRPQDVGDVDEPTHAALTLWLCTREQPPRPGQLLDGGA
jgi:8-oxo-dGTP pyrophosphatase MutT (NUDIX family)